MGRSILFVVAYVLSALVTLTSHADQTEHNKLTAEEKAAGWELLWDGETTDGWRSARAEEFPKKGWEINRSEERAVVRWR